MQRKLDDSNARKISTAMPSTGFSERRALLRAPFGLAAIAALGATARAAGFDREAARADSLDFDAYLKRCHELAKELISESTADHEPWLFEFARETSRLELASVKRGELKPFGDLKPAIEIGPMRREPPVIVIEWSFEPNAVLPPHNHQPAAVLSVCLEGECRVRHFEFEGAAPKPGADGGFRVRETQDVLLRPGRMTFFALGRDDIHTFRASSKGARGLDINVFLPGEGDWSFMRLDPEPIDASEKLFAARWTGQDPSKALAPTAAKR